MSRRVALFRVAAGSRLGHGHLRRAEVLAPLLPCRPLLSLRGSGASTSLPRVESGAAGRTLDAVQPALLVLDDPHAGHALRWCRAARRRGIPVVSMHDLGLARVPSSLAVDGSVRSPARGWPASRVCRGLAFAVIRTARRRRRRVRVRASRVLLSLGGGPRRRLALRIARELQRCRPDIEVLLPSPMGGRGLAAAPGLRCVTLRAGLAPAFAEVDLAVLGGGVSLYEAAAAGVPSVALAVVAAQRPTIAGFVRAGVTRRGGSVAAARRAGGVGTIAQEVIAALDDVAWRRAASRMGPRLVDGRGGVRVAREIGHLLRGAR